MSSTARRIIAGLSITAGDCGLRDRYAVAPVALHAQLAHESAHFVTREFASGLRKKAGKISANTPRRNGNVTVAGLIQTTDAATTKRGRDIRYEPGSPDSRRSRRLWRNSLGAAAGISFLAAEENQRRRRMGRRGPVTKIIQGAYGLESQSTWRRQGHLARFRDRDTSSRSAAGVGFSLRRFKKRNA